MKDRARLRWNGWGDLEASYDLRGNDDAVWAFLRNTLKVAELPQTPAPTLDEVDLPDPKLSEEVLQALGSKSRVTQDKRDRAMHAFGRSYADLLHLRSGKLEVAPDAIVYPKSAEEIASVITVCDAHNLALIPYGGGSSVVGGVEARAEGKDGVVTLDMSELDEILAIDEVSLTATIQCGVYGPALEESLQSLGYTLGHFPQSFEFSTLGGWIAARGAGQQSLRYGTSNKWLVAARVITPSGELVTRAFPQSAAGPNVNELLCGSEGVLGVIVEATVKIHPLPEHRDVRTYLFRDYASGINAVRAISQSDLPVSMMRLSDSDETFFYGTLKSLLSKPANAVRKLGEKALDAFGYGEGKGDGDGRCALLIGLEGEAHDVRHALVRTTGICAKSGGVPVGTGPASSWEESRFSTPYLRDPMLDNGIGIDTLETSTTWDNALNLTNKVRAAIKEASGGEVGVLSHISHSYADGCSLYFTFFFARDLENPMGQWMHFKRMASRAIAQHGGTISHHHGVGRDHAPWMEGEKGSVALAMLRAAKREVDPKGTMNPGKLLVLSSDAREY